MRPTIPPALSACRPLAQGGAVVRFAFTPRLRSGALSEVEGQADLGPAEAGPYVQSDFFGGPASSVFTRS
jgi:hypothetical protein